MAACLRGRGHRLIRNVEADLGDAKRAAAMGSALPSFNPPVAHPGRECRQIPAVWTLAASPLIFVGSSTPRSSSREAADRMTSCVSVSLDIGIPPWGWRGVVCRHHHSPALAMQPAGQDPEVLHGPGTVTQSRADLFLHSPGNVEFHDAKDRLLKSWPELQNRYHSPRTRRVSAAGLAPSSGEVVPQFQSDSARTDSPVRVLHAQPGSRVSTSQLPAGLDDRLSIPVTQPRFGGAALFQPAD
jgi:hypothetical protein